MLAAGVGVARMSVPTTFEVDAFHVVNDLPEAFRIPFETVMQVGTLTAVVVVALVALALRRLVDGPVGRSSRGPSPTSART